MREHHDQIAVEFWVRRARGANRYVLMAKQDGLPSSLEHYREQRREYMDKARARAY